MLKKVVVVVIVVLGSFVVFASSNHLHVPSPAPIPGEGESEITNKFFRLTPVNDAMGPTDKLLTGGTTFSFSRVGEFYSATLRFSWLLITPIFQFEHGGEFLAEPLGEVADWERAQLLQALVFPVGKWKIKVQGVVSNNLVGDHGADEIQKAIHDAIGNEYYLDAVSPSIQNNFISSGGSIGLLSPSFFADSSNMFMTAGYMDDYFYPQSHLEIGYLLRLKSGFRSLLKYSQVWPRNSGFFKDRVVTSRHQILWSFVIGNYWTPSFGYSSVYLIDDKVAQWYMSIPAFTFDF